MKSDACFSILPHFSMLLYIENIIIVLKYILLNINLGSQIHCTSSIFYYSVRLCVHGMFSQKPLPLLLFPYPRFSECAHFLETVLLIPYTISFLLTYSAHSRLCTGTYAVLNLLCVMLVEHCY